MPEHKGKTNKVNEVKLESSVDRVVWTTSAASVGAKAGLEIDTHFVGNGSDIKIELKEKLEKFSYLKVGEKNMMKVEYVCAVGLSLI